MLLSNGHSRRPRGLNGDVFWQAVRFGIAGLALTAFVSASYYLQISYTGLSPAVALTFSTLAASAIGFFVHSHFSFRAHGTRENPWKRFVRFLMTNGFGYLLNLAFVFVLIDLLHLPKWAPMIGFTFITPAATFALNRYWVFG